MKTLKQYIVRKLLKFLQRKRFRLAFFYFPSLCLDFRHGTKKIASQTKSFTIAKGPFKRKPSKTDNGSLKISGVFEPRYVEIWFNRHWSMTTIHLQKQSMLLDFPYMYLYNFPCGSACLYVGYRDKKQPISFSKTQSISASNYIQIDSAV